MLKVRKLRLLFHLALHHLPVGVKCGSPHRTDHALHAWSFCHIEKMQPAPSELSGIPLHHSTKAISMTRNLAVWGVAFMGECSTTWVEGMSQRVVE